MGSRHAPCQAGLELRKSPEEREAVIPVAQKTDEASGFFSRIAHVFHATE
jgi:hypothetical protein